MRGFEFIGKYKDCPVRGIILYEREDTVNSLVVFYIGGSTICKRFGRKNILNNLLKEYYYGNMLVQERFNIQFRMLKILGLNTKIEILEKILKDYIVYKKWKERQ